MAITVNGAILRNMPEQISKNVDDIADLQTTSENHETRIAALENDVVLAASFEDTTMTGTTSISDTLNVSATSNFTNGINVTGTAAITGDETVSGDISFANGTASGTITAQKLSQTAVNWGGAFSINHNDLTVTNVYSRLQVINGRLDVIVNLKVENASASNITTDNAGLSITAFPADIAQKIIDFAGNSVNTIPASQTLIAAARMYEFTALSQTKPTSNHTYISMMNYTILNNVLFRVSFDATRTFSPGDIVYMSGRFQIDLI